MSKGKATLSDIAKRSGLSIATVSRALHNDRRVSEVTRRKVISAALELGFPLSSFARENKVGRLIVLVLDRGWEQFFDEALNEISNRGAELGFEVVFHRAAHHESLETGLAGISGLGDGVVVVGTWDSITEEDATLLSRQRYPAILINRYTNGFTSAVTHDDYLTGITAANYLAGLGHRHIAYLPGNQTSSAMRDRLRGFRAGLENLGIYRPELFAEPVQGRVLEWAGDCVKQLLALSTPPTAIWTYNDIVASAVIVSLRTQGIEVPRQISVMGHDNLPQTRDLGFTTFGYRLPEIGYHVIRLAEGYLKGALQGTAHVSLAPHFIPGNTTGPAPN